MHPLNPNHPSLPDRRPLCLDSILEPIDIVTIIFESQLFLGSPSVATSGIPLLLLLVLPVKMYHHDSSGNDDDGAVSNVDGVSLDVSGPVGPGVDEGTRAGS
jgi:hypothetical protein